MKLDKTSEKRKRLKKWKIPLLALVVIVVGIWIVGNQIDLDVQLEKWSEGTGVLATISGHVQQWGVSTTLFAIVAITAAVVASFEFHKK